MAYGVVALGVLAGMVWYYASPVRWGGRGIVARTQASQDCIVR